MIALIQALPEFLRLMNLLGGVMEKFVKWTKDTGFEQWILNLEAKVDNLERAQTTDEKLNAARDLVGIIRGIK
jgi:hypothetical protein